MVEVFKYNADKPHPQSIEKKEEMSQEKKATTRVFKTY